jgi:hypothetical protein
VIRPEPAKGRQPGIDLLKGFGFDSIETALSVYRGFNETRLAQHSQVLGYGWLRHSKLTLDISDRLF